MARGRGLTSELGLRRGRAIGLRRGRNNVTPIAGDGSQITDDTGVQRQVAVEGQFQGTMVRTRGGGTAFLGRGSRIQWRGHEANVPSNYAQAKQSSQTAVGSTTTKSTTKHIFKGKKFGNLAAI